MDYNRVYQNVIQKSTNRANQRTFEDFTCPYDGCVYRLRYKEHRLVYRLLCKANPDSIEIRDSYIDYLLTCNKSTQYVWITNGDTDRRILKGAPMPNGYIFGRAKKIQRLKREQEAKDKEYQELVDYWTEQYDIYRVNGFVGYQMITGYDKTQSNLVQKFAKYVEHFIPQNGKIRKGWIHR